MVKAHVTVMVDKMPELVHLLMRRLANLLRREAGAEANPEVARRLREIAAKYEVGL